MARKLEYSFMAVLSKNTEKGGAWRADVEITQAGNEVTRIIKAWTTPSAAKRWVKSVVLAETPKKSIKWVNAEPLDEKGKPTTIGGSFNYKVTVD